MSPNVPNMDPVFPVQCQPGLELSEYDPSMGPKAPSALPVFPVCTLRLPVWALSAAPVHSQCGPQSCQLSEYRL